MSRPLSIEFASRCAFAQSYLTELTDKNAPRGHEITGFGGDPTADIQFGRDAQYFKGRSSLTNSSDMGYISKGTGSRRGEVVISFRGSYRWLQDYILIDGATAMGTSPKGFAVHGGFAKVFQSCIPDIERILGRESYSAIHCVGHSMGGALATLCAEHLSLPRGRQPYLYSFGAPRVGSFAHCNYMKSHLGDRINRYYYSSDIITWMPPFPFVHLPGKRLVSPNKFMASHGDYCNPKNLVLAGKGQKELEKTDDYWEEAEKLIKQGESVGGGCGVESSAWRMFRKALYKILYVAGALLGLAVIPAVTAIDQIIQTLMYLTMQNPNRRSLLTRWVVGSAKALWGKVLSFGQDKLMGMLRYILSLMLSSTRREALCELEQEERNEAFRRGRQHTLRFE